MSQRNVYDKYITARYQIWRRGGLAPGAGLAPAPTGSRIVRPVAHNTTARYRHHQQWHHSTTHLRV